MSVKSICRIFLTKRDVTKISALFCTIEATTFADQLYEDLLYYYNKNVRPVRNASETVHVKFGASLIRIIDVVGLVFDRKFSIIYIGWSQSSADDKSLARNAVDRQQTSMGSKFYSFQIFH